MANRIYLFFVLLIVFPLSLSKSYFSLETLQDYAYRPYYLHDTIQSSDFPDCYNFDEYCDDVHLTFYEEIDPDHTCLIDTDCFGTKSECNVSSNTCSCPENRFGANCAAFLLYFQRWNYELRTSGATFNGVKYTTADVSNIIPMHASDLVLQELFQLLPISCNSSNSIVCNIAEVHKTFSRPNRLWLKLPESERFNTWFNETTAIISYLEEIIDEWSLVQEPLQSERDALTLEKLYAEILFILACVFVDAQESHSENEQLDVTPLFEPLVDSVHNAIIWALKNKIKFYEVDKFDR